MNNWEEFSRKFDELAKNIEFWEDDLSEELKNAKKNLKATLNKYEQKDPLTLNSYFNFLAYFDKVKSLTFTNLTRVVDVDSNISKERYKNDCIKNFYTIKKIETAFRELILSR